MASSSHQGQGQDSNSLTSCTLWKGENESDAELMEGYDSPLTDAGAWTEKEASKLYREKLVHLRDLYVGQLDHMQRTLKSLRKQFLFQWQHESRKKSNDSQPSQGSSLEEIACRRYRRKSGEEALVERKAKQRRVSSSLEYFTKSDGKASHRLHYTYLMKQHRRMSQTSSPCTNVTCDNKCLPHSVKCSRHICEDLNQYLYTKCSYVYPSGQQCTNPIPKYLTPLLCGGHCDNIMPPNYDTEVDTEASSSSGKRSGRSEALPRKGKATEKKAS